MADETLTEPAPEPAPSWPRHVWLSGGGHHPGLPPGLMLGQTGSFEALQWPDGRLELVGVTLPNLPGVSLASEPANIAESQSAGVSEQESALRVAGPEPESEPAAVPEVEPAEPASEPDAQPAPDVEPEPEQPAEAEAEAEAE